MCSAFCILQKLEPITNVEQGYSYLYCHKNAEADKLNITAMFAISI
jgi:hypothetical protein